MTDPSDAEPEFDDPERHVVERRSHRKARALMLAGTLVVSLALLAWMLFQVWPVP